ncbi:MAG: hypothetical protein J1E65_00510 [Lachnospiraceae bacterium]|nr:hypothetical protein [Lachnospiraceae bacterium]
MMKYECRIGSSCEVKKRFLKLPLSLYDKKTYVQNIKLEKQLLEGRHILSKYFSVTPIVVVDECGKTAGRCMLTFYEADPKAYIGFFECIHEAEAAVTLFQAAQKAAKQNGKTELTGPLNASFWLGYRLKTNHFGSVYTAEPYNKAYYSAFFEMAGFEVSETYYSNAIRVPKAEDDSMKCRQRLQMVLDAGYHITSPTKTTFETNLREIYELLIRVYSDFPMFKRIQKQEFCILFESLKQVLDYDFVKLVYKGEELAGFFISVPNYGNLTHQSLTLGNLLKILRIKNSKMKEYVLLYMGIDPTHPGLGAAMAELIKQELTKKQARSISALIHTGKVSGNYYKELAVDRYEYALFKKYI